MAKEKRERIDTAGFFGRLAGAIVGDVILAFPMDVEPTVLALEALLEETFQKLAAKMANGGFRVGVYNESVRNLDAPSHFFLDPERPSGANRRSPVFLDVGARTSARRAV